MDLSNIILMATEVAAEAAEHASEDAGFVGTLGLNWKLFIAQLINFAVVLFILWKWVFDPVAGALEKRRQKIEGSVEKAEQIEKQMQEFAKERDQELTEARKEAQQIIKEAQETAEQSRAEIVQKAQTESERVIQNAKEAVASEKEKAIQEVRKELAELTMLATEKVIRTKLDDRGDKELIEDTIKHINE